LKLYLSARAEAQLEAAYHFIHAENPTAARKVRSAIRTAILSLRSLPHRGRASIIEGYRELVVRGAPYVIVYRVADGEVRVMQVRHTSQDPRRPG
jgi:toxin ParE1/3/4